MPGNLKVGNQNTSTQSPIVRLAADDQILATDEHVVFQYGLLDLAGRNQTMASLGLFAGRVTTGAGTLTISTGISGASEALGEFDVPGTISGKLALTAGVKQLWAMGGSGPVDLDISAVISGPGASITILGPGGVKFSGSAGSNSYGGATTVDLGTLVLDHAGGTIAVPGPLFIGTGTDAADAASVKLLGSNQIAATAPVTINKDGALLILVSANQTVDSLTMTGGSVDTGTGTLTISTGIGATSATIGTEARSASIAGELVLIDGQHIYEVNDGPAAVDLDVSAVISGTGYSLKKSGAGVMQFSGDRSNSYKANTEVLDGILLLARTGGGVAVPSYLIIGDSVGARASAVVRFAINAQLPEKAMLDVESDGLLDLNGHDQSIDWLGLNGGDAASGSGTLTLSGDMDGASVTVDGVVYASSVSGNLLLTPGTHHFTAYKGDGPIDLDISAVVTGPDANLYIESYNLASGVVQFSGDAGSNSYGGWTTVFKGATLLLNRTGGDLSIPGDLLLWPDPSTPYEITTVRLLGDNQIPPTADVLVGAGSWLDLNGHAQTIADLTTAGGISMDRTVDSTTVTGTLTLTGNLMASSAVSLGTPTAATIEGNLDLSAGTHSFTINRGPASTDLDIGAAIVGPGGFTMLGDGILRLSGERGNTYAGKTAVNEGTLELAHTGGTVAIPYWLTVGDGSGGLQSAVVRSLASGQTDSTLTTILSDGLLDLNGFDETLNLVVMTGGTVTTGAGTLTIADIIEATSATIDNTSYAATILGKLAVTTQADFVFQVDRGPNAVDLDVSAAMSGEFIGLRKLNPGVMRLSGGGDNTYGGLTSVEDGVLELGRRGLSPTIPGNLLIGDGLGDPASAVVRFLGDDQIATSSGVSVNRDGWLDLYDFEQGLTGLNLTGGRVSTGDGVLYLTNDGTITSHASDLTATISGNLDLGTGQTLDVADGAAAPDLLVSAIVDGQFATIAKTGAGELALAGAPGPGFSGFILVDAGRVDLNNWFLNPVTVFAGGMLGGTAGDPYTEPGHAGEITIDPGGTLGAGTSVHTGILAADSVTFQPFAPKGAAGPGDQGGQGETNPAFQVVLNGTEPGVGYDQVQAPELSLQGATLRVLLGQPGSPYTPTPGDRFTIISGPTGDVGQFAGLPEGAEFLAQGAVFSITYLGGDGGHDVVLTAMRLVPTVTLDVAPAPSEFGQQVTFTATVSASLGTPGGVVEFYDGDPAGGGVLLGQGTLTDGTAVFVTPEGSPLAVGTHTAFARYPGSEAYTPATSEGRVLVVAPASTRTTLIAAPNPSLFGQAVTFTAQVSCLRSSTAVGQGSVQFYDGTSPIGGPVALSATGVASVTTAALGVVPSG
ncbi:MAG: Ig-like domain repeat protein, partial [Isosphaeraceae bacterium]